jgi:hypothetical protein
MGRHERGHQASRYGFNVVRLESLGRHRYLPQSSRHARGHPRSPPHSPESDDQEDVDQLFAHVFPMVAMRRLM